ncbi:MAG: hypothetical protein QOK48_2655 [Blastocatellia bacterium]|jgi:hypothetical protein|nr:hypothetical protein [Blastocatellia bacterium]
MALELAEVERRMQPGAWFTHGFLQESTSLAELLANDAHTLTALGVKAEQVGQKLAQLLEAGAKSDWFWPFRTGEYKVEIRRRRGFITCPWAPAEFAPCVVGHGSPATANQFLIRRRWSRQRLEGFELSAHLIRDHAFFGGPGTRLRIEPEQAVAVLGLRP